MTEAMIADEEVYRGSGKSVKQISLSQLLIVSQLTLRRLYTKKRLALMLPVLYIVSLAVPIALILVDQLTTGGIYTDLTDAQLIAILVNIMLDFYFPFVLTILLAIFVALSIADEITDKTIVYLLSSPLQRHTILFAKMITVIVSISLIYFVSLVAAYFSYSIYFVGFLDSFSAKNIGIFLGLALTFLGYVVVYTCLFMPVSIIFKSTAVAVNVVIALLSFAIYPGISSFLEAAQWFSPNFYLAQVEIWFYDIIYGIAGAETEIGETRVTSNIIVSSIVLSVLVILITALSRYLIRNRDFA